MTEFAVWAPEARRVRLRVAGGPDREMTAVEDGWWRLDVPEAVPGADYAFLLDEDDHPVPDPRSPWQPRGVHGPSRVYDHAAFAWTDRSWPGRRLPGSLLYEVHVGTFTPEGSFDAAIEHLDHVAGLGVDLIELLPVNAIDEERDQVSWFAPHPAYGGPDGLKRLVDAAHARGLGVILDIAYHPAGRPALLDGRYAGEVRRHLVDSALMWLRDYHADGLRLDAGAAVPDGAVGPLPGELTRAVEDLAARLGRPLSLIPASGLDHDRLVGERAPGDGTVSPGLLRVGATLALTVPVTPMLFMGEEWAATSPWHVVTVHPERELVAAVAVGPVTPTGYARPPGEGAVPRPVAPAFLDWSERDRPEHREMLAFHRRLIALRKSRPEFFGPEQGAAEVRHGDRFVIVGRGRCLVAANLAARPQRVNLPGVVRHVLLATADGVSVMRDGVELPAESAVILTL